MSYQLKLHRLLLHIGLEITATVIQVLIIMAILIRVMGMDILEDMEALPAMVTETRGTGMVIMAVMVDMAIRTGMEGTIIVVVLVTVIRLVMAMVRGMVMGAHIHRMTIATIMEACIPILIMEVTVRTIHIAVIPVEIVDAVMDPGMVLATMVAMGQECTTNPKITKT